MDELKINVYDEDDNPLEGVDVNLYNGSTLWDTLTTGSDGTVSKTYTSQGSGDIVFTAEVDGTLLTKTYSIRDVYYANTGLTDKSADFDVANLKVMNSKTKGTVSITSDGEKYNITTSGFGNQAIIPIPKLNGLTSDYKFSVIVKNMGGLIIYNTPVVLARVEAPTGRLVYSNGWNSPDWHTQGTALSNLSTSTEYELQLISNGSTFTVKILDLNGNQLGSWSYTNSSLNNSTNNVTMGIWTFNSQSTLRNLTLELL